MNNQNVIMRFIGLIIFLVNFQVAAQLNFFNQNSTVNSYIFDIEMVNILVGYAVGENGVILKTTNGGQNWVQQTSGVSSDLLDCQFANENLGWACGDSGIVLKTVNGGSSWSAYSVGSLVTLKQINIIGTIAGLVAGQNTATNTAAVYYTTDGGGNWTPFANIPVGATDVQDIEFTSVTSGFVIDYYDVFYTPNSGSTWIPITIPSSQQTNRIEMYDSMIGWLCGGNGLILKTIDGGTTWLPQNSGVTSALFGMDVIDSLNVWVTGFDGTIISTNNGGLTWTTHDSPVNYKLPAVSAPTNDDIWVCGQFGTILHNEETNLTIENYLGTGSTCPFEPFEIKIQVKNGSNVPVNGGTFVVSTGGSDVLIYNWSGSLAVGATAEIVLGSISLYQDQNIVIAYTGDDNADGNVLVKFIDVIIDEPFGTSGDFAVCPGSIANFYAYGGLSYNWLNASDNANNSHQSITIFNSTEFYVEIQQSQCLIKDTIHASVTSESDCFVTAFSPNGDGKNDYLIIENLPLGDNIVTIFNRWGDELVEIQNYNNNTVVWDGNDGNGNSMNENTYFYIVEFPDGNTNLRGWIQVVR